MKKILFCLVPMVLLGLTACEKGVSSSHPSQIVVAEVNGNQIKGDFFLEKYREIRSRMKIAEPKNKQLEIELKERILAKIIDTALLKDEARKAGLEVSASSQRAVTDDLLKGFSSAGLQLALEKSGISLKEWRGGLRDNMMIQQLVRAQVAPLVEVPEEEVKEYFAKNKDKFHVKKRVHGYHIVVQSLSEANEIRNNIEFGDDFGKMARKYSISPDAASGGDLGMFSKGEMPLEFDNVLFELKIGEISKVVESPYGFHIFKITEKFKPRAMKYPEAREIIYNKMFNELLERKFKEWMKEKRESAKIVIYSQRLRQL